MEIVSLATSLSEEQQNKFAQLLFKTHMSYLDAEEDQPKSTSLHFQKCLQKVNYVTLLYIGDKCVAGALPCSVPFTGTSLCNSLYVHAYTLIQYTHK